MSVPRSVSTTSLVQVSRQSFMYSQDHIPKHQMLPCPSERPKEIIEIRLKEKKDIFSQFFTNFLTIILAKIGKLLYRNNN